MKPALIAWVLLGLTATGEGRASPASLGPPDGARLLCSGHVSGAPSRDGGPAAHITWQAYTSEKESTRVVADYRSALGTTAHSVEGRCDVWRIDGAGIRSVVRVCPIDAPGPWSGCAPPPSEARCLIELSSLLHADES